MASNTKRLIYENEDTELIPSFEKRGYRTSPILYVNGKRVLEKHTAQARPNQTLLSFLRDVIGLTGSKLGCAEGGCGACTVMISKKDVMNDTVKHIAVNACLMPVLAADGCHVTTVEGIGTVKGDNLHPIQTAMVEMHGSQCGFCTPGIIVSIYSILANNPSTDYLEEHLDGNLCRCTGYRPIWDAARSLLDDAEDNLIRGPCGTPCRECPEHEECRNECNVRDKKAELEEEKKTDPPSNDLCCSSSVEKAAQYKDVFLKNKNEWLEQPNAMFPKELLESDTVESTEVKKPLIVVDTSEFHSSGTWIKPTSLLELLMILQQFGGVGAGGCKIVVGNTEVGIETRFKHAVYPRLIFPSESIESLYSFSAEESLLIIGSCTPLSIIQHECGALASDPILGRTAKPIHDMLRWFASSQIRNVACLGGNLVTASPISDMNPMLACMGAKLILSSATEDTKSISRREVSVSNFFLKYRVVDLSPTEIVEQVEVPVLKLFEYLKAFKQARRREDDISIVTAGMRMRLGVSDDRWVIEDACIAFGGMAPRTILAKATMDNLTGSDFSEETFEKAKEAVIKELALPDGVPGGQSAFRMALCSSFLHRFYISTVAELQEDVEQAIGLSWPAVPTVDEQEQSGATSFVDTKKPSITGTQTYPAPKVEVGLEKRRLSNVKEMGAKKGEDALGKPSPHQSGPLHCTGEALYTDDIPLPPSTLQAALVLATECGSTLEGIDKAPALLIPGVVGVYTYNDIEDLGGKNELGPIVHDEFLFLPVGQKVSGVGQVLGVVVGESLESAESGARAVAVKYSDAKDKLPVSVEDAVKAKSFYDFGIHSLERGDIAAVDKLSSGDNLPDSPSVGDVVTISGSFRCAGQEHFYLETNSTLAVPTESNTNLTIYCSTQAPTKTQTFCASTTGTPASKVVVRMKRMGGGFGGKETRSVFASCAAAVAAKKSSRPVRLTLSRETDMMTTGTRHSFLAYYKASAIITHEGAKLHACDIKMYCNGGMAFDLTGPVNDRAIFHSEGVYFWPHFRAVGTPCKTAQPIHTAFRGFGGPQGMAVAEHIIDHLSMGCKIPSDVLRRINMYKEGDHTPFGMTIGEHTSGKWNVPTMWDRIVVDSNVAERRKKIKDFNSKHKWVKKGLAVLPTKFGIAFTAKYMNQGGALVHLYTDGTVLVTHGGTEMGQGLHTKVCQVAAQAFGISVNDVYVNDTSTDKVANTIPTAASMSTDTYGMATLDACRQIIARLDPIREKLGPDASLGEIAHAAFLARIDLSAHGFFALDDSRCGYFWDKEKPDDFPDSAPTNSWKGHPFNYFTQGVAVCEVEIDALTGNHRTIRCDLLMDVGSSINPAIDIGQIEGAFTQGMGWSTIEEPIYADDDHQWIRPYGKLFTTGPGTYKIPAFNDVPETFNITLLDKADNPFAVHSSKAIGEPPFFLGTSVFYAAKEAVREVRKQNLNEDAYFEFRMPATSERIRMACADSIAQEAASQVIGATEAMRNTKTFQARGSY